MKKLAFILACLLLPSLAQAQPNLFGCNKTASINAGAATTKAITEAISQGVHLCGWDVGAGAAAGGFQIISGTGATCGTGTANITGAYTLAINAFSSSRVPYAQFSTASGQAICVITTGTGPTTVTIYYAQF